MAKILIVDDNIMNCKMALRILEPLQMETDTAENGKIALEKISRESYDIVLMDHMMPIMDGVEAVRQLRVMEGGRYQNLPVIALSAATEPGTESLFLEAGMNDFVMKPIQAEVLYQVLRKWLPEEKSLQQLCTAEISETNNEVGDLPDIAGVDVKEGVKNSGGVEFFYNLLGIFYQLIDIKAQKIVQCIADNMIRDYTVEVHGLKNTARMIGAMDLSREFEHLERLGNAGGITAVRQETPQVLEHYLSYKTYLKSYAATVQEGRKASVEELVLYLQGICDAMEGFDLDSADAAFAKLDECLIPEACGTRMEKLRAYIADVDMEHVIATAKDMIEVLENERG